MILGNFPITIVDSYQLHFPYRRKFRLTFLMRKVRPWTILKRSHVSVDREVIFSTLGIQRSQVYLSWTQVALGLWIWITPTSL